MTDETFKPKPDPSKSEQKKPAAKRKDQIAKSKLKLEQRDVHITAHENPIVGDETYGALREDNRVVMRHTIALNIDNFRASSDEFTARPTREYPPLAEVAPPFFSVIVANYNGQRHLPVVLSALRRQSFTEFEVIVADDASSDDSVAIVEREFPEVRLLVNRRNLGFAATCNTGADAAAGRFLVMLNSDTEPEADWLKELALAITANPTAAAIQSKLLLFDKRDILHSAGDVFGVDGLARNRGVWQKDSGQFDDEREIFSACGGAAAYRRDLWQALGGFDEEFWMYLEDVDFGFRARLAGWNAVLAPQARVYHHLSASGGDVLASFYVARNALWLLAKDMPEALLWRNLLRIVGAQLRVSWDALRNIRGAAARARLRGQLAGLAGLAGQLHKRRLIQSRRVAADSDLARMLVD